MNVDDLDDPPGCAVCGAIAGACKNYPECPGNPNWKPVTPDELRKIADQIEGAIGSGALSSRVRGAAGLLEMLVKTARQPNTAVEGDVFQINEKFGRVGWTGAFVLVTEVKEWGVQGYVHHINTDDHFGQVFIRLKWEHIDYIGHAKLVPLALVFPDSANEPSVIILDGEKPA